MATLAAFLEQFAAVNPFTANRVNSPSADAVDVDGIHDKAFQRLVNLAREARDEHRGLGIVLGGEAGVGKSHLLARFSRWSQQDKNACFVYLHNLQASPDNLPRALLKAVISILTRGRQDALQGTFLFRIVNAAVRAALTSTPDGQAGWEDAEQAYGQLVDRLSAEDDSRAALVDRTTYHVLFRFFRSAYSARYGSETEREAQIALRWLAGDFVDAAEARQLGISSSQRPDEPSTLADNQQIKQVLIALNQLALWRNQPFILCFDQVDNLDAEQASALGRFLEAWLDGSPNLLAVVAGIKATLLQWRHARVIQDSAWDRIVQFEIDLHRVNQDQARAIISARLQQFLTPFRALNEVRRRVDNDPLFPLGRPWFEHTLANKPEVRPRDMISWARECWRREQERLRNEGWERWLAEALAAPSMPAPPASWSDGEIAQAIDRKVVQKMAEQRAFRAAEPHTLAVSSESLAGLLAALLGHCSDITVELPTTARSGAKPAYDLKVYRRHAAGNGAPAVGVICIATQSKQTATWMLRRLAQDATPPERVVLVTEERRPLALGDRGQELYDELRARGARFRHIELTFAQYAEWDALQAAVGLARSGDLEVELPGGIPRPLSEDEVIASHQRAGRYREAAVLGELVSWSRLDAPEAVASVTEPRD